MSEQKKYETRELSGSAFRNRRKQQDTHPDFTGEVRINGQLYWFSMWEKRTQSGEPWFSLGLKVKEDRPAASAPAPKPSWPAAQQPRLDEDTPF